MGEEPFLTGVEVVEVVSPPSAVRSRRFFGYSPPQQRVKGLHCLTARQCVAFGEAGADEGVAGEEVALLKVMAVVTGKVACRADRPCHCVEAVFQPSRQGEG